MLFRIFAAVVGCALGWAVGTLIVLAVHWNNPITSEFHIRTTLVMIWLFGFVGYEFAHYNQGS